MKNDDLISRRKAIQATWEETLSHDPINVRTEIRGRIQDIPSAQAESHYEFGIFDGVGNCIERGFTVQGMAETICAAFNRNNPQKRCRVLMRLVMKWEEIPEEAKDG